MAADLGAGAVDASKVADNSLGGAQIDESSLAQVPAAQNAVQATSAATAVNATQLGGQSPAAFQQRIGGTCTGSQAMQSIAADGTVGCGGGGGGGTTYTASANGGLALTGTAFRLAPCATGQVLKATGASTWACAADSAGGPPTGAAAGDLAGTYPAPTIATNAVNSAEVADNSLSGADIGNGAVGVSELEANSLRSSKAFINATVTVDFDVIAANNCTSRGINAPPFNQVSATDEILVTAPRSGPVNLTITPVTGAGFVFLDACAIGLTLDPDPADYEITLIQN